MGPAHLSRAMNVASCSVLLAGPTPASAARALVAFLLVLLPGAVRAQSPLSRQFERAFFARREVWIDRLFGRASPERRAKAIPLLHEALSHRGWADSLAGTRAKRLTRTAAVLAGFEPEDPAFRHRFNFYLLALPEVVDPGKRGQDRVILGEISRRVYPLLKPVRVEDPDKICDDADKIFLTARGVFGADKPKGLTLRFRVEDRNHNVVGAAERGDSESDDAGWLMFDLNSGIPLTDAAPAPYFAYADLGVEGRLARASDPPLTAKLHLQPGYHQQVWELLRLRRRLEERPVDRRPRPIDLDRLDVLAQEVMRVLFGTDYLVRSWPVQALREALALARRLEKGEREELPARGDRVYGIRIQQGRAEHARPLRVVWGASGKAARAFLVFPPAGFDENYVVDGLGVPVAELAQKRAVFAFTPFPLAAGYLKGAQQLLREEFGIEPRKTSAIGFLDGGTRLRYALGLLDGPLDELVYVGREIPDAALARSGDVRRLRVVPAYGRPATDELEACQRLLEQAPGSRPVRFHPVGPRSFAEAFRLLLD